jgi:hypothetical protein
MFGVWQNGEQFQHGQAPWYVAREFVKLALWADLRIPRDGKKKLFSRKALTPNPFGMIRNCGASGMNTTARPRWWLASRSRRSTSAGVRTPSKPGARSYLTMNGRDSPFMSIPPTLWSSGHPAPV